MSNALAISSAQKSVIHGETSRIHLHQIRRAFTAVVVVLLLCIPLLALGKQLVRENRRLGFQLFLR